MLRMYVVQQCFALSDEGIEDAIYDSHAIRQLETENRQLRQDNDLLKKKRRPSLPEN